MGIGKILAERIAVAGKTVSEVAREVDVPVTTLQSIIDRDSGKGFTTILRVARVLGTTAEELYREAGLLEKPNGPTNQAAPAAGSFPDYDNAPLQRRRPDPETTEDVDGETLAEIRSQTTYLRCRVPGLYDGAVAGDLLVISQNKTPGTGDTGVYRWSGRTYVCRRRADRLEILGPYGGERSLSEPHVCVGKVTGLMHEP